MNRNDPEEDGAEIQELREGQPSLPSSSSLSGCEPGCLEERASPSAEARQGDPGDWEGDGGPLWRRKGEGSRRDGIEDTSECARPGTEDLTQPLVSNGTGFNPHFAVSQQCDLGQWHGKGTVGAHPGCRQSGALVCRELKNNNTPN